MLWDYIKPDNAVDKKEGLLYKINDMEAEGWLRSLLKISARFSQGKFKQ